MIPPVALSSQSKYEVHACCPSPLHPRCSSANSVVQITDNDVNMCCSYMLGPPTDHSVLFVSVPRPTIVSYNLVGLLLFEMRVLYAARFTIVILCQVQKAAVKKWTDSKKRKEPIESDKATSKSPRFRPASAVLIVKHRRMKRTVFSQDAGVTLLTRRPKSEIVVKV